MSRTSMFGWGAMEGPHRTPRNSANVLDSYHPNQATNA